MLPYETFLYLYIYTVRTCQSFYDTNNQQSTGIKFAIPFHRLSFIENNVKFKRNAWTFFCSIYISYNAKILKRYVYFEQMQIHDTFFKTSTMHCGVYFDTFY